MIWPIDSLVELREWAAIHNNPPPPQWKPAERPGFSRERELRSRRGHLAPLAQKSKDGKKKAAPGANKNAQPPYLDSPFDINDRGVAHMPPQSDNTLGLSTQTSHGSHA